MITREQVSKKKKIGINCNLFSCINHKIEIELQVLSDVYKKCPRSRYIVGYEVAGIVTQAGSGVSNVNIGDSVIGKQL